MVSKNYYSLMINNELWAVLANKKNKIMENTSLDRHADSFGKIWFKGLKLLTDSKKRQLTKLKLLSLPQCLFYRISGKI